MAALTSARSPNPIFKTIAAILMPLAAGSKAFRNGLACLDTSSNTVKPGASGSTTLVPWGWFEQDYDNSAGSGSVYVQVRLFREIVAGWWDSVTGGNAVTSSNLFQDVYIASDHEVTTSSSGNSKQGRVLAVDSLKGILTWAYPSGQ